jgi:enoyl-CoA hydratase/carnithine racemase
MFVAFGCRLVRPAGAMRSLVTMQTIASSAEEGGLDVHHIALNDGKMNAFSHAMLAELSAALDTCAANPRSGALLLSSSNPRCFSAGFDLGVMGKAPSKEAAEMLELGGRIALRLALWQRPTGL